MLSIVVLGIGAAGVMSMQKASIQGNNDARMMDMANAIAREWQERLTRDGMTWTQPDEDSLNTQNWSTNTFLISQIAQVAQLGTYQNLVVPASGYTTGLPSGYSRAFDILGRDVAFNGTSYPNAVFCAQVRGDWLLQDQLLRTTVRVYWLQQMLAAPAANSSFCVNDTPDTNSSSVYHFLYAVSAVRRTPGT
jgi:hypothetical protein